MHSDVSTKVKKNISLSIFINFLLWSEKLCAVQCAHDQIEPRWFSICHTESIRIDIPSCGIHLAVLCSTCADYMDVDCNLHRTAVPVMISIRDSPSSCSLKCEGDKCNHTGRPCQQVNIKTANASSEPICRTVLYRVGIPSGSFSVYIHLESHWKSGN